MMIVFLYDDGSKGEEKKLQTFLQENTYANSNQVLIDQEESTGVQDLILQIQHSGALVTSFV